MDGGKGGQGQGVWSARLEHHRRALDAARLEIDQGVDPARHRIAAQEGAGAEQAHLLAFVEQEGDGTGQRLIAKQKSGLQQGGDADSGIAGAWAREGTVIMGGQEQMAPLGRTDGRDDVADPGAGDRSASGKAVADEVVGHARAQSNRAHLGEQAGTDFVARFAVDRVRPLVAEHARQPCEGTL